MKRSVKNGKVLYLLQSWDYDDLEFQLRFEGPPIDVDKERTKFLKRFHVPYPVYPEYKDKSHPLVLV